MSYNDAGGDKMNEIKTTQQFDEEVLNSSKPVFVDFWAEWCGPCRAVSPAVEEVSKEYEGKVDFAKVNVDDNNELATRYNIFSIPTLAIFQNGKIIAQQAGAVSKDKIKSYIDSNITVNVEQMINEIDG